MALSAVATPITFQWQSTGTNVVGYKLTVNDGTNDTQFDTGTNTTFTIGLYSATWTAFVQGYSSNNFDHVRILGDPSSLIYFYVPGPPSAEVNVDNPFVPPVLTLASNPIVRVTILLEKSSDLVNWSAGVPLMQCDLRDNTNSFYRTKMSAAPIP